MASRPYIQFYQGDYLSNTMHLSTEMHGAYFLLILHYWQTGKAIRDNDENLARIVGLSLEQWLNIRSTIVEFFEKKGDFLLHKRIEKDLKKAGKKSANLSKAGKASAAKRRSNADGVGDSGGQQMFNKCSTNVDGMLEQVRSQKSEVRNQKSKSVFQTDKGGGSHTRAEVDSFALEFDLDLTGFFDFYEKTDWRISGEPIRNWKGLARSWSERQKSFAVGSGGSGPPANVDDTDWAKDLGI